jgi:hypothetical protein
VNLCGNLDGRFSDRSQRPLCYKIDRSLVRAEYRRLLWPCSEFAQGSMHFGGEIENIAAKLRTEAGAIKFCCGGISRDGRSGSTGGESGEC